MSLFVINVLFNDWLLMYYLVTETIAGPSNWSSEAEVVLCARR